ncbi:hypothetical protein CBOM_03224 [Ceraceosorus bombacis]|uniref:DUF6924 domain-containing protein n=1 Tax=Ceraceosorus bombacis TaxID=401625 RepID=A0A0P1BKP5_9BASI|nr:hypothetical protein CBOM_03224 [Ceraceosorus bombacis]
MAPSPIFNLSAQDADKILSEIRSSGYIREVASDVPPEESGLWDVVHFVPDSFRPSAKLESSEAIIDHAVETLKKQEWDSTAIVLADERTAKDGSLLIYNVDSTQPKGKRLVGKLRAVPRSVIEVVCNLQVSNMDLKEYANCIKEGDVFDAGS